MSTTTIEVSAPAERVFDVLLDPYAYPRWVVGARRIRGVDRAWPEDGSAFHHTVGFWPILVDDHTRVLGCEPPSRLKLRARAWPFGEADVTITLDARGGRTLVTMHEEPVAGPARDRWNRAADAAGHLRNSVSLMRLKRMSESPPGPRAPSASAA